MADMTSEEKKDLYNRLEKIDANIQKIFITLNSDNNTKQAGLVEKVNNLELKVSTLEMEKKVIMSRVIGYVSGGILVGTFLLNMFKMLFGL
jgi:3-dehydroquinate dehydratase